MAPQTGGATAAATTTVTAAPGSGSSGSGSSSSGNGENHDAAIGAGVGVPLGVLALLAVGWALAERKKRYALIHQTQHMMLASNVAGAGAAGYKPEGYAEFQELSGQGALQELEAKRGS